MIRALGMGATQTRYAIVAPLLAAACSAHVPPGGLSDSPLEMPTGVMPVLAVEPAETTGTQAVAGTERAFALSSILGWIRSRWNDPSVPVCWESMDAAWAKGRHWTREAVEATWETHSAVDFTGWEACSEEARGIRIVVADRGAETYGLGSELDNERPGMMLNFTLRRWNAGCRQRRGLEACVRIVAVHEFGHALGFAHEQNRPETRRFAGDECARQRQGTDGEEILTPWDPESVMNYCNGEYLNAGQLSEFDIKAVQQVYGLPRA